MNKISRQCKLIECLNSNLDSCYNLLNTPDKEKQTLIQNLTDDLERRLELERDSQKQQQENLQKQIEDREEDITRLRAIVTDKDKIIDSLTTDNLSLETLQQKNTKLEKQYTDLLKKYDVEREQYEEQIGTTQNEENNQLINNLEIKNKQ